MDHGVRTMVPIAIFLVDDNGYEDVWLDIDLLTS